MSMGHKIASSYIAVSLQNQTGPGLKSIGGKLIAGFGALGLGSIIGKSISTGLDFQAGQSKLNAQLGLTKTQAGVMGKATGKLFSSGYGTGMEQINEAARNVALNIGGMRTANADVMADITGKVVNTANIFDQDLGGVTKAVGQLMKTGLAKNATEALDIVTRGFQVGADKSGDFLDTLNEYGTQFRKMGLSGAQATGIISQGLQAGARDGDLVADAIKEFSIRAIDGSTTTAAGFKALGMSGEKMGKVIAKGGDFANEALADTLDHLRAIKDPVKQSAAATALFGTQAEDLGKALYAIHPETAAKALGTVKGAADAAGKSFNDNARANMGTFFRQLQFKAVSVIGGVAIPALTKMSGTLSNSVGPAFVLIGKAIKSTSEWLKQHSELIKNVATVVGPAVAAYVLWRTAIGLWSLYTKIATGVQIAFNAVMNANPIMLVVIGIGLLVGAVILAYTKVSWFRAIVDGAFRGISAAAKVMWNSGIKPAMTGIVGAIEMVAKGYIGLWNNVVGPVIRAMVGGFLSLVSTIIHGAASAFGWVPGLGGKLRGAAAAMDRFRADANAALAKVTRRITIGADVSAARNAISNLVREAGSKTAYIHVVTIGGPGGVSGGRQAFAKGGFPDDGEFTVGEEGPELMRKRGSRLEVLTNRQMHHKFEQSSSRPASSVRGMGGMHIDNVHLTVQADEIRQAADLFDLIQDAARRSGTGMNQESL